MLPKIFVSADLLIRMGELEKVLKSKKFTNPHPDLLYFNDLAKLGVEQAKQIREFLSLKPYQAKGRGVVIESADNLTLDAQNALLKTLEELPEESLILLGVSSENSLLPTILSRCQLTVIASEAKQSDSNSEIAHSQAPSNDVESLQQMSLAERFNYIEKLEEREAFLQGMIHFYQNKLKTDKELLNFAKILLEAEKWHKANGNIRAILEYLMLKIK